MQALAFAQKLNVSFSFSCRCSRAGPSGLITERGGLLPELNFTVAGSVEDFADTSNRHVEHCISADAPELLPIHIV